MNSIFSYNSKFFQLLIKLSNMVLLNVLYLVCCIPVITIGPAQAGMFTSMRVLQDPDDESSCFKAFFRGFSCGFGVISLISTICFGLCIGGFYILASTIYWNAILENAPVLLTVFVLVAIATFQGMAVAFHSRFQCSLWQIIRNSGYMVLMHPIRALGMVLLIWGPVLVALLDGYAFLKATPVWMFIYYTLAFYCCTMIIKAPFAEVEEQFC